MTLDHLDKIKERLAKITPWPWTVVTDLPDYGVCSDQPDFHPDVVVTKNRTYRAPFRKNLGCNQNDAEFIAHAPEDIAALVEEIENLQDEVASNRAGWAGSRTLNQKYKAALEKIAKYRIAYGGEVSISTKEAEIAQEALK